MNGQFRHTRRPAKLAELRWSSTLHHPGSTTAQAQRYLRPSILDVVESNFSNDLSERQVQKAEACHQKKTEENKFNWVSSFAHRVALLSYAHGRTPFAHIVERHVHRVALFMMHKVV